MLVILLPVGSVSTLHHGTLYMCVWVGWVGRGGGRGRGFQTDNKQKNNNDVILLPVVSVSAFYSEH